jgi:preprotein translocase subunit SecG
MKWLKLFAVSVLVLLGAGIATGIGIVAGEEVGGLLGSRVADDLPQVLVAYAVLFLYVFLVIMISARHRRKVLLRELAEARRDFAVSGALAQEAARTAQQLERHYALVRTHAPSRCVASLAAAVVGFAIVAVAALTSDQGIASAADVGTALSAFLTGGLFLLHRRANRQLVRVADDLRRSHAHLLAAQVISEIQDQALQDEALRQLARALVDDADVDPAAWQGQVGAAAAGTI